MRFAVLSALIGACGPPPRQPEDPTPGKEHFKVASYNVEFGKHTSSSTVAAVGAADAQIVSLQEVTPEWEQVIVDTYSTRYPYMLFHSEEGAAGLATLSEYPLEDQGVHAGPGDWHPAWHVLVMTPAGPLQILNVHLRALLSGEGNAVVSYLSADQDHRDEIDDFTANCTDGVATLVLGDFNEGPEGDAIHFLESRGFRNILPLYHPGQPTWRHASVGNQIEATVDHILFNDVLKALNSFVVRQGKSDHIQVVAHFEPADQWLALAIP